MHAAADQALCRLPRSRREEYWMFALMQFLVLAVLGGLFAIAAAVLGGENGPGPVDWGGGVRRFDELAIGMISLVPYVGFIVLLVFMCIEDTPGPNEYGENPSSNLQYT
ncbi:hypothetical protein O1K_09142 [Xanthomonas fragariae LMG 25863]|nr:hypothetical protein O1K_09142 [Xanthomonas fragariae LMG 25863]